MTAKLAIVQPKQVRLDRNVIHVSGASYPQAFGEPQVGHNRKIKKGEITRFIQMCVEVFFTETLGPDDRHQPVDLYQLKAAMAPEVEGWVRKFSKNSHFQIQPWKLSQAIRTMEINGVKFRIEGRTIQLPESAQDNITSKLEIRRGSR